MEVVRDYGNAGQIEHSRPETSADTLAQEYLAQ